MNPLLLIGLVLAIFVVLAYVLCALRNDKKPELVDAIVIFIGVVSVIGAIRLVGFVFTQQFIEITKGTNQGLFVLSSEDAVLVVIGGLALAWVSTQTLWDSFAKVAGGAAASKVLSSALVEKSGSSAVDAA